MGSRREEERNEKIIRGLMKLPPNRRCINCNSLGPQYVCTNFWTFICINCSGIHREFTHRVKSVSMAKFTSQEVEALQNGGNQRAREVYLKDWDTQRQRLPDSSNADKIRQFIKQVYVDKRYAGGKNSDKPSNDVQGIRSPEEETRRASSYHSYSQSPPYDYQYEERRYGKQGAGLSRKPGSDRGLYEGKMSSIIYSPGRLSEHAYEDRFANEGSAARFSDYSVSSGGDPFRSSALSPNFQKDVGFSSPPVKPSTSSDSLDRQTSNRSLEANFRRDTDGIPRPQRTASSGSFGSLDSNTMSLKSFNSGSLVDAVSEPEQVSGPRQDKVPTFGQPTASGSPPIDLFQAPFRSESASSSVDLFQTPATFSSGSDLFHSYSTHPSSSPIQHQTPQTVTSTVDFFADFPQPQSDATLEKGPTEPSSLKNEGWATFDSPQPTTSTPASENVNHVHVPLSGGSSTEKFDLFSSFDSSMNWPLPEKSSSQEPSPSVADPRIGSLNNVNAPSVASNSQTWNAFGEASEVVPSGSTKQIGNPLTAAPPGHSASSDQYLGFEVSQDINIYGFPRPTSSIGPPDHSLPSNDVSGTLHPLSVLPLMGEASVPVGGTGSKPSNPFDLPFDNDVEHSNMFLDMGSLQAALPAESQVTSTFLGVGGVTPSWFSHNSAGPYASVAPQGGLSYMAGQAAGTQIPNVATQGPVASIGGNPFA